MRIRKSLIIIAFMLMLLFLPLTLADWEHETTSGTWQVCTRTNWEKIRGDSEGLALWNYSLSGTYHGYYAKIRLSAFEVYSSWRFFDTQRLQINYTIGNPNVTVFIEFSQRVWLWGGLTGDPLCEVLVAYNGTLLSHEIQGTYRNSPKNVEIFIWKSGNDLKVRVLDYYDKPLPIEMSYETINVGSAWFTNTLTKMEIEHKGFGYFNAWLSDTVHETTWTPSIVVSTPVEHPSLIDLVLGLVYDALPQFMKDWIDIITVWGTDFIGLAGNLFYTVTMVIPILPLAFLFWIMDSAFTSIQYGHIEPIGRCFSTIITVFQSTVSLIVNSIHAIYDFIHFW